MCAKTLFQVPQDSPPGGHIRLRLVRYCLLAHQAFYVSIMRVWQQESGSSVYWVFMMDAGGNNSCRHDFAIGMLQ
ncbi:hypothetical protein CFRS1_v015365 [Colletotrichum fructicola]|nr:hypothetical protein CFRS1_v015365 [Colletotrichum fructicola]